MQEKIPYYLNPLFYSYHGDKEAVSDTSFIKLVSVSPSLRNSNNNFSSYFPSPFVYIERVTTVNSVIKKKRESPIIKEIVAKASDGQRYPCPA